MPSNEGGRSAWGRFGSGRAVKRIEDPQLVRGRGRFVDDVSEPGQLYLAIVRSDRAHARLRSVDVSRAAGMPGVVAVITAKELAADGVGPLQPPARISADSKPPATPTRHLLALDTVRYVGEAIAAIVAATRAQAREACAAVAVDYDELPSVVDAADAAAPGAPVLHAPAAGNVTAALRHGNAAAVDAAFRSAAHVVALDLINQRLAPSPLEPRGALAVPDPGTGRLTLRVSSQMPAGVRNTLADVVLGIEREKVRVLVGDVGGGFGMKTDLYTEEALTAYCARKLQRPVKWNAERSDEFLASAPGRDQRSHAELALDANGKVLALRVRTLAGVGAYATPAGVAIPLMVGPWVITSVYDIAQIDLDLRAVLTNTAPTGAYRGAGRPEAIYLIERLMDAAARKLGMDRAEIRRRNMIRPAQMPYRNAMQQTYDSGQFERVLDQALAIANWDGFDGRAAQSRRRGRLRGIGIATFLEWTGGNVFDERVVVTVSADGTIEIVSATQAMGQGIATSYAQLAVDVFGVPIDRIRIVQGDTDRATGFGSGGSRSLFTGGSAVRVAASQTVARAQDLAAEALEASASDLEYADAEFRIVGTDRRIGLFDLAARQPGRAIAVDSTSSVEGPSWPNGGHICEVEVDPLTGTVEIVAYASVNDVGRVINPTIVRGQLSGGVMQGIGQALCEQVVYDRDSGQLLTGSFLDYALPRADLLRSIRTEMDESTPCLTNPLGVKGVGELGTIGATPAVVNAVIDALVRGGCDAAAAQALQMPLTSERVWKVLQTRPATQPAAQPTAQRTAGSGRTR